MSNNSNDAWQLTSREKIELFDTGTNVQLAAAMGVEAVVNVVEVKNVRHKTVSGTIGFMLVKTSWVDEVGVGHSHNLRFNDETRHGLSEDYLYILGSYACSRPTDEHDYSIDQNGLPLSKHAQSVVEIISSEEALSSMRVSVAA